jgi:hypothetical protein
VDRQGDRPRVGALLVRQLGNKIIEK